MKKLILLLLAFTGSINFTYAQWQSTNGPSHFPITSMAASGTNIFVGSGGGGVFLSSDSGTTWTAVNNGLTDTTVTSLVISGASIFAGTGRGIFLSTNNGTTWTDVNNGLSNTNVTSLAALGINIFAGTSGNGVFLSTDNGGSWTAVNNGFAGGNVTALAVSGTNIFAGTLGGYVNLSTDTGSSWTEIDNYSLIGPITSFAKSDTDIFVGSGGGAYLSTNNGSTWSAFNNGLLTSNIMSLAITGSNILAATYGGGVFLSTDTIVSNWRAVNNGLTDTNITSLLVFGTNIFAGTNTAGAWKRKLSDILTCVPVINASSTTSFACYGSVTLSNNLGSAYSWSDGETTKSITVTAAGDYSCNVTTSCGNITSNVIRVSITSSVVINASSATYFFCGDSVTLTESDSMGSSAYLWSDGETTQSIVVRQAGNYSCNVTTGCGNITSNVISVVIASNYTISPGGATSFCQGGSVTLSADSASSYLWDDGETTQNIVVTTSGNYLCNVSTVCGTLSTNSIRVNVNPYDSPVASITPAGDSLALCPGTLLTASNVKNSQGNSYLWSNGATTSTIIISTPQIDSVTITDGYGCSATTATNVATVYSLPSTPVITPGGPTTFCDGDSVVLTSSAATGYNWSNGATTQSIAAKSTSSYSVIVINANGCSSANPSNTISVTIHSNPVLPIIHQFNNSLKSSDLTENQWYLNGTIISGATGQFYIPAQSGEYTVVFINSNGCSATSTPFHFTFVGITELINDYSFSIYPNPATNQITLNTTSSRICCGTAIVSIMNILGQEASPPTPLQWRGEDAQIDIRNIPPGMYFLQMKTENGNVAKKFVKE